MYRKICARPSRRVAIFDDQILNWHNDGGSHKHWLSELTLDGAVLSESPIPDEHLRTIGLECGQCMVEYEPSGGESSLSCFAPCGALLVSIKGLGEYPEVVPRGASEFYLLGQHLFSYNSRTLQHEDLGLTPWDLPIYRGACGGLHFLTEAWQTRLLALRDAGGRGLEDVWRIDFAERDQHVGWHGRVEPGQVNFLNLYGDDAWISTHVRTYRVDIRTGQIRAVRARFLPEFLVEGGIGYSLCPGEFRAMDMARGVLLREGPRLSFPLGGEMLRCGFEDLLVRDGILYVSVSLWSSGLYLLAAFDTQAERFVWHDAWGGCSLDSVHIVGDRLIACDGDEVRIYARE
ncbi:MAG: hypothetical protein ACFNOP_04435 [Bacteroides sp.]